MFGGRGPQTGLAELPLPARYEQRLPQFVGRSDEPAYNVAHAYAQLLDDLTAGTHTVPDFTHAVRRHRLLDQVKQAATAGKRHTLSD